MSRASDSASTSSRGRQTRMRDAAGRRGTRRSGDRWWIRYADESCERTRTDSELSDRQVRWLGAQEWTRISESLEDYRLADCP